MKNNNFKWEYGKFKITDNKSLVDIDFVYSFLRNAYWSKNIPKYVVIHAIKNSHCFSIYHNNDQVGFARIVSDNATFAYLCDVFILENYQNKGLGKWLIKVIVEYPNFSKVRRFMLATNDAHDFYQKAKFKPLENPEIYMEIYRPNIYSVMNNWEG